MAGSVAWFVATFAWCNPHTYLHLNYKINPSFSCPLISKRNILLLKVCLCTGLTKQMTQTFVLGTAHSVDNISHFSPLTTQYWASSITIYFHWSFLAKSYETKTKERNRENLYPQQPTCHFILHSEHIIYAKQLLLRNYCTILWWMVRCTIMFSLSLIITNSLLESCVVYIRTKYLILYCLSTS